MDPNESGEPNESVEPDDLLDTLPIPSTSSAPQSSRNKTNRQVQAPQRDGFMQVMEKLCGVNGVALGPRDLDRLRQTFASEADAHYIHEPPETRLSLAGIAVDFQNDSGADTFLSSSINFDFIRIRLRNVADDTTLKVQVDPSNLNALGLTILSWVLLPGARIAKPFLNIIEKVTFENCLVNFLQKKPRPSLSNEIIIPAGWLYWLNIPYDFVQQHVTFLDLTVCVASLHPKKWMPIDIFKRLKHCLRISSAGRVTDNPVKATGKRLSSDRSDFLLLDRSYQLIYLPQQATSPEWELSGLNASAGVAGFTFGGGGSRQRPVFYDEKQSLLFRGHIVQFYNLSHFVGFTARLKGGLITYMKRLQSVLDGKAVFPKGRNQCFLTAMTKNCSQNTRVPIFPDRDCRVKREVLMDQAWQDREENPIYIYFQSHEDRNAYYRATCQRRNGDLHHIADVTENMMRDDIPQHYPLSKDLGG